MPTKELILTLMLLSTLASIKTQAAETIDDSESEAYQEHAAIEREQRSEYEEESISEFCADYKNEKAAICLMQGE